MGFLKQCFYYYFYVLLVVVSVAGSRKTAMRDALLMIPCAGRLGVVEA